MANEFGFDAWRKAIDYAAADLGLALSEQIRDGLAEEAQAVYRRNPSELWRVKSRLTEMFTAERDKARAP